MLMNLWFVTNLSEAVTVIILFLVPVEISFVSFFSLIIFFSDHSAQGLTQLKVIIMSNKNDWFS